MIVDPTIFSAATVAPTVTKASAMLFGTALFAMISLIVKAYLVGGHKEYRKLWDTANNPRSSPLDIKSLTSIYTLLYHTSILGFILFYAYICEYHPPFPHTDKNYDADIFFFLTFLLFVVSAYTWKRHDNSINNNNNTNNPKQLSKVKESTDSIHSLEPASAADDNNNNIKTNNSVRAVADANPKTEILN